MRYALTAILLALGVSTAIAQQQDLSDDDLSKLVAFCNRQSEPRREMPAAVAEKCTKVFELNRARVEQLRAKRNQDIDRLLNSVK